MSAPLDLPLAATPHVRDLLATESTNAALAALGLETRPAGLGRKDVLAPYPFGGEDALVVLEAATVVEVNDWLRRITSDGYDRAYLDDAQAAELLARNGARYPLEGLAALPLADVVARAGEPFEAEPSYGEVCACGCGGDAAGPHVRIDGELYAVEHVAYERLWLRLVGWGPVPDADLARETARVLTALGVRS